MLYHYTTASGFLGIVRDQAIRATNFSFLNDSSEVAYGLNLVTEIVLDFSNRPHLVPGTFDAGRIIASLRGYRDINDLYVACFTALRDDLGQWRGYGGRDTDRFCLGMQTSSLAALRASQKAYANVHLVELLYDDASQRELVESVILNDPTGMRHTHELLSELSHLTLRFKNPTFAAEHEWRVAVSTLGTACEIAEFVVAEGHLKPYIELRPERDRLEIAEVILLPSRQSKQTLKAAQLVMERYGYQPATVCLSNIPFVG